MRKKDSRAAGAAGRRKAPAAPLGQVSVCHGDLDAVCSRFEEIAGKAWFTTKISALQSGSAEGSVAGGSAPPNLQHLQVQQAHYELSGVPTCALGDEAFAQAIKDLGLSCLSRGCSLGSGNVFAIDPHGELVASLDGPTFERLGVEEPSSGAGALRRKLMPTGHRHVKVGLGISKTRRRRAATPEQAEARWRALAPNQELCSLFAYAGNEHSEPFSFAPIVGPSTVVRRVAVPVTCRSIRLGEAALGRPPIELLVCSSSSGESDASGELYEDLLDWIGALHMGVSVQTFLASPGENITEDVWLWSMGETLLGPLQILHTLTACKGALHSRGSGWFLLSFWSCEDASVSHHGGAHGFDLNGAHHVHLLVAKDSGAAGARGVLIEAVNSLDTFA